MYIVLRASSITIPRYQEKDANSISVSRSIDPNQENDPMCNLSLLLEDLAAIQNRWYEICRDRGQPSDGHWLGDIAYGVEIAHLTARVFLEESRFDSSPACEALRQLDRHWQSLIAQPLTRRDTRNPECVRDGIRIICRQFSSHVESWAARRPSVQGSHE